MRFSIIIPAHNAENHMRRALDSIKSQTFTDYELIVVCDRCTDGTEELARSYGARTVTVDYGRDGLSRNAGLELASGQYVLFMDDDDWWLHEFVLEQLNKKLKELGEIDLLCFSFIWKGVIYASPLSNFGTLYPSVWNKCWKRKFIGDTRFSDVYSISDKGFHDKMMMKPHDQFIWDMPMYYYNYLRPGSISHEMGRTYQGTKKFWEEH